MLQRVDQGIGSGSVSEWGPASSGVVRSAPVHTTAGIPALVILQYCHPKSCAVFLCSACANTLVADIVAVVQLTANGTTEVVAQSVAAFKTEVDTHAQAFSTTDLQELNNGLDAAVQCVQCGLLASLQRAPALEALAHDGLTLRSVGSFTTAAGAVTLAAPAPAVAALQQRRAVVLPLYRRHHVQW